MDVGNEYISGRLGHERSGDAGGGTEAIAFVYTMYTT